MSDYIKREDAIKAMARGIGIPYTDFIEVAERCMDDIQNADVAEVVRCRDCVYYQDNNDGYPTEGCKWRKDETPDGWDFCSEGDKI